MKKYVHLPFFWNAVEQQILIIDEVNKTRCLWPFKSQISNLSHTSFTRKTLPNRVALLQHEVALNQIMVYTVQRYPRNITLTDSTIQKNHLLLSDLISCYTMLWFVFNGQTLKVLMHDCRYCSTLTRKVCSLSLFRATKNRVIPVFLWFYGLTPVIWIPIIWKLIVQTRNQKNAITLHIFIWKLIFNQEIWCWFFMLSLKMILLGIEMKIINVKYL